MKISSLLDKEEVIKKGSPNKWDEQQTLKGEDYITIEKVKWDNYRAVIEQQSKRIQLLQNDSNAIRHILENQSSV